MATVVTLSDHDLCALAELVSRDREPDVHAVGLPPSLLRDLMARMRCDRLEVLGLDSIRQELRFLKWSPMMPSTRTKAKKLRTSGGGRFILTRCPVATLSAPGTSAAS